MSIVCMDTSAYSRLARGEAGVRRRLESAVEVLVPVPVLGELQAGFRMGSRVEENLATLADFLRCPGVRVVPMTEHVADRYGHVVKQLRDQGTPIPTNDIWIAAVTLETGARLLAYDDHFRSVPGLIVESP